MDEVVKFKKVIQYNPLADMMVIALEANVDSSIMLTTISPVATAAVAHLSLVTCCPPTVHEDTKRLVQLDG